MLPDRRESDTFAARRERQQFFQGRTFLPDQNEYMAEDKKKFPRKNRSDKCCINVYIIYLFYYLIRYFMFPRKKVSSEQIFQKTAVVDCSRQLRIDGQKFNRRAPFPLLRRFGFAKVLILPSTRRPEYRHCASIAVGLGCFSYFPLAARVL